MGRAERGGRGRGQGEGEEEEEEKMWLLKKREGGRETNTGLMRVKGAAVERWMSGGTPQRPPQSHNCKQRHIWQKAQFGQSEKLDIYHLACGEFGGEFNLTAQRTNSRLPSKGENRSRCFGLDCCNSFPGCLCCSVCVWEASIYDIFTCIVFCFLRASAVDFCDCNTQLLR